MVHSRESRPVTVAARSRPVPREEFFYQLGLRQFGNYNRLRLEPPPSLQILVKLAVEAEPDFPHATMSVDQAVQSIVGILVSRAEMLEEYFALKIDPQGCIVTLPLLLRDYTPNLDKLPLLLMRLGPQVSPAHTRGYTLTMSARSTGRPKKIALRLS